ncbi:ribonuclease H-like domain-containing protein [Tanacetum coccineum]|uniref:Ribonuclease H-like domain-containing protein n=1 Tax=Tanacetum coccineum TaxID=301880 RepID=A0ABQ4WVJ5_9ASTR
MDDLYNNLNTYETEVKGSSSSNQNSQNVAFVSSNNSGSSNQAYGSNSANTDSMSDVVIYSFFANQSNSPQLNDEDLQQIDVDDLEEMDLKWQMAMLTMRAKRFLNKTGRKINPNGSKTIGFNKSKVECYNCHKKGQFARKCRAPMENRNREPVRRNVTMETTETKALVAQDGLGYDGCDRLKRTYKLWLLMAYKSSSSSSSSSCRFREYVFSESPDVATREAKTSVSKPKSIGEPLIKDWISDSEDENETKFKSKQRKPSFAKIEFVKSNEHVKTPKESVKKVENKRQAKYPRKTVKALEGDVTTAGPKAVVSDNKGNEANAVKASTCWGNPHLEMQEKGVIDSGCSRHMTGNMSYLSDYEEIDGGFVAFGGDPKGGRITGKGKISTGKLDFEYVYFVKELKFNLFSVSQMCDKKNSVLFTNTKCVVLSPDFKLLDKNHVLLRVSRKDNMYSVDLKNIVPSVGIENLIDLKVKVIRCDNRTEFKNKVMNQFCEMKGIKREFSVARTPQQNRVAERKNRTLIEAARTMLADSKLPTTFWAEAVNTACYVQNRVLVIKPHNKTPYELFLGRKPALSFMRPFACPDTILNTLDHLEKFDGKADEGFFVGYSTNSKAYRVFNSRTRIVEENLHVKFSEETPNIAGNRPNWLFDIDALTIFINYKPVVAGNQTNDNACTKENINDSLNAGFKPLDEEEKIDYEHQENEDSEVSNTQEPRVNQEQDANVNSTNNINTVNPTVSAADIENNVVDKNIVYECIDDPNMPNLEEIVYSNDDEEVGAEADMNNLEEIVYSKDVTSEILKTFITCIENLIDLKVKVIRCDNRTEFKDKVMNQFCEIKGIKREFSVARTPQQNRAAERKSRTLIEAARTMLADSKLLTTFWAEAVNTACRKPALSFMRPFRCPDTILNTLDHLGKFVGKADEGLFIGYSTNSKAYRVFNNRTRIVEENLHVKKKIVPDQEYILLPLLTSDPSLSKSSKDSLDAGFKPSGEEEKIDYEHQENKDSEVSNTQEPRVNQEQEANVNNTNNINTINPTVSAVDIGNNVVEENIVYECIDDPNMPNLEETVYSDDDEEVGAEADMNNLATNVSVCPIPTTRVHKDHPLE